MGTSIFLIQRIGHPTKKMLANLFLLLILGLHCVVGTPLAEEKKRWGDGQAASNSGASNSNNINLGKKAEEEKRWWGGNAASNSGASNTNNIRLKKEEEEKRWWDGNAASNSGASNTNNISLKKKEEEKRWWGGGN